MLKKAFRQLNWLPDYLRQRCRAGHRPARPQKVFLCICDHFEPYWGHATNEVARQRIEAWCDHYPRIAEKYQDSEGRCLPYTFFYPVEQYTKSDLRLLQPLVENHFGEVEVHLHHHNDTARNLTDCLREHKKRLYGDHGMLSEDIHTREIGYGFIHGNWALDNAHPQGLHCGVNNEIEILSATGCFADFTLPSAPHPTQTRKVNAIYRALDDPQRPKSHDCGPDIRVGEGDADGLLMIQGPLMLNWRSKRPGLFPGIDNAGLQENLPPDQNRFDLWQRARVHVWGKPSWIFIKLHTHGAKPAIQDMLLHQNGLANLLKLACDLKTTGVDIHFVSARELVNIVRGLQHNQTQYQPQLRDYRYVRPNA